MEIKNLLQIGVGKTGNVLLNEMMELDKRYVGLFVNSAKGDMENLSNYTEDNSFAIPQANGSGKDREKAKGYIRQWSQSFFELLSNYSSYDTIVFYFSLDGGTGSGSVPTLATITKNLFKRDYGKDVNIIAVGVMPNSTVGLNGLKNAVDCYYDIKALMRNHIDPHTMQVKIDEDGYEETPIINTLYLIDNNKRNGNYEEINAEAVEMLNLAFQFDTLNTTGDLDKNDSTNINLSRGYNLLLKLDEAESEEQAILDAKENSVFVMPSEEYYNPQNIGIALKYDVFDRNNMDKLVGIALENVYPAPVDEEDEIDGAIFFGGIRLGLIENSVKAISDIITDRERMLSKDTDSFDDLFADTVRPTRTATRNSSKTSAPRPKPAKAKPNRTGRKSRGVIDDSLFEI